MAEILIIDDDRSMRETLHRVLHKYGFNVIEAGSGEEGIKLVIDKEPDLVLLDLILPDMQGLEVLKEIKSISPQTSVVIITAFPSISDVVEAMKLGASEFLVKPFNMDELVTTVRKNLEISKFADRKHISDEIIKALSHPLREKIVLHIMKEGPMKFSTIASGIGTKNLPKLSYHVKILLDAGILMKEHDLYQLTPKGRRIAETLLIKM